MTAKEAKHQLEFMIMMILMGRPESASVAAGNLMEYLEAQIAIEEEPSQEVQS